MEFFQYIRVPQRFIPHEIKKAYNLVLEVDGYSYFEIRKGMYGLKEAGIIAYKHLVKNLLPYGYAPMKHTPGVWNHRSRKTTFTLCVDDFGVKYFTKGDAEHLIAAIQANYKCIVDWTGSTYCGMNLQWNYDQEYVDVAMHDYVNRALTKYNHTPPQRPQHAPHAWLEPKYGKQGPQLPTKQSTESTLNDKETKRIQSISGTLNYYSEIDPCIKPALNEISREQAKPTLTTKRRTEHLLDYLATNPDATLRYDASDMILVLETDAAYLVQPEAKSRAAGWFVLTNKPSASIKSNAPMHVMCSTIKNVVASAAEAEIASIYLGCQRACPMQVLLAELGHPQPPDGTPVFTDNQTAKGILTSLCRQKLSKAFDMRYYWIKDRIKKKQFKLTWRPGVDNMADYFSKHHPPWYHKKMRYKYLQKNRKAHEDEDAHKDEDTPRKIDDIHVPLHTYTCSHDHTCT